MSQNAVLIGGSYGVGAELARMLLAGGYSLQLFSRTQPQEPALIPHWFPFNAENADNLVVPNQISAFAYLPGSIHLKPFTSFKESDFLNDLQVNFLQLIPILQKCYPSLKASGNASVTLFSTVAVQTGMPFHTSVASAKGAVEGLARALAAEWAPNVRVNVVAPSLTNTPLAEKLLNSDAKIDNASQRHPLKRIGQPADIAAAAYYLLSNQSGWITGQVISVDGGMSSLKV